VLLRDGSGGEDGVVVDDDRARVKDASDDKLRARV
jgi:hypothetical protein